MGQENFIVFDRMARFARCLRVMQPACMASSALLITPASAQTIATPTAGATIIQPLSLNNSQTLDFGTLVNSQGGGTVLLSPISAPDCTTTGGILHTGTCQPAKFNGLHKAGNIVKLEMPSGKTTTLTGPGGATMTITDMVMDSDSDLSYLSGNPKSNGYVHYTVLSPSGQFAFRIGGTLNINAGQASGVYTSTFSVSLDYQ